MFKKLPKRILKYENARKSLLVNELRKLAETSCILADSIERLDHLYDNGRFLRGLNHYTRGLGIVSIDLDVFRKSISNIPSEN